MFNNSSFTEMVENTVPPELTGLLGAFGFILLLVVAVIIVIAVIIRNVAKMITQKARDAAELIKEREASRLKLIESSMRTEELKVKQAKIFEHIRQKKEASLADLRASLTKDGVPKSLDNLKGDVTDFVEELHAENTEYDELLQYETEPYEGIANFDSFEDAYGDVSITDEPEVPAGNPDDPYANLFTIDTVEEVTKRAKKAHRSARSNVDSALGSLSQEAVQNFMIDPDNLGSTSKPRRQ